MGQSENLYADRGLEMTPFLGDALRFTTAYKILRLIIETGAPGFCGSTVAEDFPHARCFTYDVDISDKNTPHLSCELVYDDATTSEDLAVWYGIGNWTMANHEASLAASKGEIEASNKLEALEEMTREKLLAPGVWGTYLDNIVDHIPPDAIKDIAEKHGEDGVKGFCADALCRAARMHLRVRRNGEETPTIAPFLQRIYNDSSPVLFSRIGLNMFEHYCKITGG